MPGAGGESDEDGGITSDNDDTFTSVALSSHGPRDPYLGTLRGARFAGGGRVRADGKWEPFDAHI
jgi:hypothetical protein